MAGTLSKVNVINGSAIMVVITVMLIRFFNLQQNNSIWIRVSTEPKENPQADVIVFNHAIMCVFVYKGPPPKAHWYSKLALRLIWCEQR